MANPTIEELQKSSEFELIAKLNHNEIKEFVLNRFSEGGKIITAYIIYQIVMVLGGLFFFAYTVFLFFRGNNEPFYYSLGALVFCFTLLIVFHELLHGVALKMVGAKNVNFGAYIKKFVFYAEANRFVLNRKQFAFVALAPFVVVKLISISAIFLFISSPQLYFFVFLMSAHSLFCAGDIGLLSVFYNYPGREVFSFDIKNEKTSYYFLKNILNSDRF